MELRPGESVRVVDEPSSEADAEVLRRALALSQIKRLKAEAERDALRASVAEGPKLAPDANAGGESNHAAQAASGGGEPVAWGVTSTRSKELCSSWKSLAEAQQESDCLTFDTSVVPLYRAPPQPRGWLTGDERKWIEYMKGNCVLPYAGMACMEAILARSSPPEVELPALFSRSNLGDRLLVEQQVRQALAAAGVAVKEVGK